MRTHPRRTSAALNDAVVVITGASSGIGRAAAVAFSRAGSHLVLAARRRDALLETAGLCHQDPDVVPVVADVTQRADLERLADVALQRWGRIDVWVNNAGATMFGRLDEGDFDAHRQVIETNLIAAMYASRLVMPVFRRQGHGVLINVGSVLSQVGQAFVPAYAISKFGLRGLSEALRSDVADEPDIHVCTLLPYAVDTPHFESGANAMGRRAHAMPFVQSPEQVAQALVQLASHPRRQRYIPRYIPLGIAAHALMPRTAERLLLHALERFHLVGTQPTTEGALFDAEPRRGTTHGSRPPITSRLAFVAWALGDLGRMGRAWLRGPRPS